MTGLMREAGLHLEAGDDGTLPVTLRWVHTVDGVEAYGIVRGTVCVAAIGDVLGLSLTSGELLWQAWPVAEERDVSLDSSGGVVMGPDGDHDVRVYAPHSYDLRVNVSTGEVRSMEPAGAAEVPPDLRGVAGPAPTTFTVDVGLIETVARWPDGRVAWRLVQDSPQYDELEATEVDGVLVLPTSTGHVLALDIARDDKPAPRAQHQRHCGWSDPPSRTNLARRDKGRPVAGRPLFGACGVS